MKPTKPSKNVICRVFYYLSPLWTGFDGKVSLRAVLAIFFSWKLVENIDYGIQKWAADRTLEGLESVCLILAGLIAALLGITAWSNISAKRIDTESTSTHDSFTMTTETKNAPDSKKDEVKTAKID